MTPLELHERVIEFSKRRKARHLTLVGPGDMTDLVPMIVLAKGDRYVGALAPQVNRDLALNMAYFGVQTLQPDVVVLVTEGFGRLNMVETKEESESIRESMESHKPGQFKEEFEAGLPGRYEMLIVHTTGLDGEIHQWTCPFRVKGITASLSDGRKPASVEWLDEFAQQYSSNDPENQITMSGFLPDSLAAIAGTPMPERLEEALGQLRKVDKQMTARGLTALGLTYIYGAGVRSGDIDEVLPAGM